MFMIKTKTRKFCERLYSKLKSLFFNIDRYLGRERERVCKYRKRKCKRRCHLCVLFKVRDIRSQCVTDSVVG